jgi:tetratricopeptide (TPR) repeat protein
MPELELVGRVRERAALRGAIAVAAGSGGGILLVAGDGGVGKTALVESVLAGAGEFVLRGAADQRAVRPYAPMLAALERLGRCAQLHGDLAGAAQAWQEAAEASGARGEPTLLAELQRRLAGVYELQGAWDRALAARAAAAEAFARLGLEVEASTERLAAASHLRSAAKLTSALELVGVARPGVERAGSMELRARALALGGQIRVKLGDAEGGMALAREGLAVALAENLTEAAADAYYRLASALEHAAGYPEALDAYAAASDFCRREGIPGTAQICFACLAPVMVKTGEWDRAVEVCRSIVDAGDNPATARMVAAAQLGMVHVLRGQGTRSRRLLADSLGFGSRNELFGLEVEAAYGLVRADALGGRVDDALRRARDLTGRIAGSEERHYSVPALRWLTTFFAGQGLTSDLARAAELLSRTAGILGTAEAVAGLGHASVSWRWPTATPPPPPGTSCTPSTSSATSACRTSGPRSNFGPRPPWRPPGNAGWPSNV